MAPKYKGYKALQRIYKTTCVSKNVKASILYMSTELSYYFKMNQYRKFY